MRSTNVKSCISVFVQCRWLQMGLWQLWLWTNKNRRALSLHLRELNVVWPFSSRLLSQVPCATQQPRVQFRFFARRPSKPLACKVPARLEEAGKTNLGGWHSVPHVSQRQHDLSTGGTQFRGTSDWIPCRSFAAPRLLYKNYTDIVILVY